MALVLPMPIHAADNAAAGSIAVEQIQLLLLQDAPTAAKKLDTDLDDYFKGKEAKKDKEAAAAAGEGADASSEPAAAADDTAAAPPPAAE